MIFKESETVELKAVYVDGIKKKFRLLQIRAAERFISALKMTEPCAASRIIRKMGADGLIVSSGAARNALYDLPAE